MICKVCEMTEFRNLTLFDEKLKNGKCFSCQSVADTPKRVEVKLGLLAEIADCRKGEDFTVRK